MAIKDLTQASHHLFLCNGSSCSDRGAADSTAAIRAEIRLCGLHDHIHTSKTLCNGRCDDGPVVIVQPDGLWYKQVTPTVGRRIVREHLRDGEPLAEQVLYQWGDDHLEPVT